MLFRSINDEIIGTGIHRSGWPYVMSCLRPLFDSEASIVFDDFAEKTFFGERSSHGPLIYKEPWVGIFHHAPDAPEWYRTQHLTKLSSNKYWQASIPTLRIIFTLAPNLADWFLNRWDVPCVTVRHPTEVPVLRWSPQKFLSTTPNRVVQVGWYGRNTHAIFQIEVPNDFTKIWLKQNIADASINHFRILEQMKALFPRRKQIGLVSIKVDLNSQQYDLLLSTCVVFLELMFAVANNTIIECIARSTPIIVNRLPGPEYYLGKEYPLFYDDISEVPALLSTEQILAAHEYLNQLDKEWITGSFFLDTIRETNIQMCS